jgi:hypothetical protein
VYDGRADMPRLTGLVVVLVAFFALPALVFLRLADTAGSTRVAVQIVALVLPATGALILRVNPDLIPSRASLRSTPPSEWLALVVVGALLLAVAWLVVDAIG